MNFPGLDPAYTLAHHAAHLTRLITTWSLPETCEAFEQGEKVLVVATTALGDSILTTPLIETLSASLGPGRVSLLVKTPYAELYQPDPRLHRVFSVRGKYRWGSLREKLAADPHRIALLANMTEPDLVPFLWRCGVRGFLRYRSRWTRYARWMANDSMLRRPRAPDYASGHAIDNNLAMAEALGVEPATRRLSLPHLMVAADGQPRGLLIHPGASREIKRWPVENWARLADTLAGRFNCPIALTGDRSEHSLAARIAAIMQRRPFILAGKLSLPDFAKIQSQALAFLSGDTGPYHMAVAVGCPTVTLFAPTDRGSSVEACGPHQAPAEFHRALQTARLGDPIHTISLERVLTEATAVIEASLAREAAAPSP
ncbi:MAG TPA: glycosyltransferase family 9 protein [Candidatus Methylacidiphilales bacterium]|jgi:ADP-heptose:LPS heptosyltransferase|nr:glycosyltransferase family 9 protein [Candidatus Methylacidiphilales bacterium]